jgi:adenosylhomocysteinase
MSTSPAALIEVGLQKIDWVAQHSPVLELLAQRYLNDGTFRGLTIGMAIPIGPKVAHLATVLQRSGAQVVVTAPDPHFIQADTAVALASRGVIVYGSRQQADEEVHANFEAVLAHQPDLLLDDRAHLVTLISTTPTVPVGRLRGASDQTTTGVSRLRALERAGRLTLPVVVANDARCKHMFDNRYGTGQSILSTLLDTTNLFLGGKVVVVAGYGWVGRGVAMRIRGMHGRVIVTEVNPVPK